MNVDRRVLLVYISAPLLLWAWLVGNARPVLADTITTVYEAEAHNTAGSDYSDAGCSGGQYVQANGTFTEIMSVAVVVPPGATAVVRAYGGNWTGAQFQIVVDGTYSDWGAYGAGGCQTLQYTSGQLSTAASLAAGSHTVAFVQRSNSANLDRLEVDVITPTTTTTAPPTTTTTLPPTTTTTVPPTPGDAAQETAGLRREFILVSGFGLFLATARFVERIGK